MGAVKLTVEEPGMLWVLKAPFVEVSVWVTLSLFVTITDAPSLTVIRIGLNMKLLMVMAGWADTLGVLDDPVPDVPALEPELIDEPQAARATGRASAPRRRASRRLGLLDCRVVVIEGYSERSRDWMTNVGRFLGAEVLSSREKRAP